MGTKLTWVLVVGMAASACQTTKHRRSNLADRPEPAANGNAPGSGSRISSAATGGGGSTRAAPPASDGSNALPFPTVPKDKSGLDLIRVKIFPHAKGDPRTGAAENRAEVAISGKCRAFVGKADRAEAAGKQSRDGARFVFTASKLSKPAWLECDEPASVERGGNLQAYRYAGNFYVRAEGGGVEVINVVPIETYLRGVVPTEVIPSWPAETLRAQAIAARTYAYYNIAYNLDSANARFFDVDDTAFFQAYSGVTIAMPSTDESVAETAGVVLSWKGRVVLSFFNTDAGGFTESAQDVFGINAPYCKAKKEPFDLAKAKSAWSKTFTAAELAQKLGSDVHSIAVEASDKTASGRARSVTAKLAGGGTRKLETAKVKKALHLKSGLFTISAATGGGVKIDGSGSGHGVGLSQKGAKELVTQKGWDHKQILAFYYDGTTLCTLLRGKSAPGIPACQPSVASAR